MLWTLLLAAVAAFAVAASTTAVIRAQQRENLAAEQELARYKASVALQVEDARNRGVEAGKAAAGADVKAADANRGAAEANARAAEAHKGAAEAEARAATANERASALEKDATQARLEQERLKATLAWRTLSPKDVAAIQQPLSAQPGSVNVWYTDGDPEALFLAIQFAQIFQNAHWTVSFTGVKFGGALVWDIAVPDAPSTDTQRVRLALQAAGIQFSTAPIPPMGFGFGGVNIKDAPTLMVGSKRPAVFR